MGELQGFVSLVKEWAPAYKLNHKSIVTFFKHLLGWYTAQIKSIDNKEKDRPESSSAQSLPAGEAVQISHIEKCSYLHSLALVLTTI